MKALRCLATAFLPLLLATSVLPASNETIAMDLESRLKRFGPASADSVERRQVLLEIDGMFLNDSHAPLKMVAKGMISTALSEITGSTTTPSIWYIWNMGYVLKTSSSVVGFDLSEVLLSPLNEEQKRMLGETLDILFAPGRA